jgi:hypothetical protein
MTYRGAAGRSLALTCVLASFTVTGARSVAAIGKEPKIVVDNDRVTVRDVSPAPGQKVPAPASLDAVVIDLEDGKVAFVAKGTSQSRLSPRAGRAMVVELKDHPVPPLPNLTGFPKAFPRPGSRKLFENQRVTVWDYTWTPGVATPMHFHDTDVVVVYLADGALKSTTPDGTSVVNEHSYGYAKFNARDRIHTETLIRGAARAIIVELK